MIRLAAVVLAPLLLAACATPHAMLRDPASGQTVNCTLMAKQADRNVFGQIREERLCIQGYKASGFQCVQGDCAK